MNDDRSREQQIEHWIEALECVMMTKKYKSSQLAERLNVSTRTTWEHLNGYQCPRPFVKKRIMERLKQIIKEPNQINIYNHGRVHL